MDFSLLEVPKRSRFSPLETMRLQELSVLYECFRRNARSEALHRRQRDRRHHDKTGDDGARSPRNEVNGAPTADGISLGGVDHVLPSIAAVPKSFGLLAINRRLGGCPFQITRW